MINIFIADDHELVREGLKKIISNEIDMKVIGEASNSEEILSMLRSANPDILLLDINLPGRSGIEILKDLTKNYYAMKVIMLSIHPENLYAEKAFKLGAWGYLSKEKPSEEILAAIRIVTNGMKYISKSFAQQLVSKLDENVKEQKHEALSEREMEVLKLIAVGKTVKEISASLFISVSSVNTYRKRIFEKLGLTTNTDLIYFAIQNGFINIE